MQPRIELYSLAAAGVLLGISPDAMRMRVRRGDWPGAYRDGRVVGIPKVDFWRVCVAKEKVGLIRVENMPQAYRDERVHYAGDAVYDDVLRGKKEA